VARAELIVAPEKAIRVTANNPVPDHPVGPFGAAFNRWIEAAVAAERVNRVGRDLKGVRDAAVTQTPDRVEDSQGRRGVGAADNADVDGRRACPSSNNEAVIFEPGCGEEVAVKRVAARRHNRSPDIDVAFDLTASIMLGAVPL